MSVFDPAVNEKHDGDKDKNKNEGGEQLRFPEQQKDEQ